MSNNDTQCVVFRINNYFFESEPSLSRVLSKDNDSIEFDAGDVIYTPAYKLQYVDEIVTPAVPAKPVEPEIGLSWNHNSLMFKVIDKINDIWIVYWRRSETGGVGTICFRPDRLENYVERYGYPTIPEVPAVTKTVRKWIKL